MNVERAWEQDIIGRGSVVSILDDGIEHTHPDLKDAYVSTVQQECCVYMYTRVKEDLSHLGRIWVLWIFLRYCSYECNCPTYTSEDLR